MITDLGGSEEVHDVLVRPDGKIIVSATSRNIQAQTTQHYLLRYNANGTPDSTFGANGRVAIADPLDDLQLLPDGDVVGIYHVLIPNRK